MGAEGSEGIEGTGAGGTGAVVGGVGGIVVGAEEVGAGGSSVGSATGGRSASGISAVGWSLRWKMKGTGHGLPPIDSKGGLATATTLQYGLGRKADVLHHLAQDSWKYERRGLRSGQTPAVDLILEVEQGRHD